MTYFEERVIYYYSFFEKALQNVEKEDLLNRIGEIFFISPQERMNLTSIVQNEIFTALDSAYTTDFYLSAINFVKGSGLFGENRYEYTAIQAKKSALEFYEHLTESDCHIINAFEKNAEHNRKVSTTFGMYYCFANQEPPLQLLARIKKNALNKEYSDIEALLFLQTVERENTEQYKKVLEQTSFFKLNKEQFQRLELKKKEIKTNESNT